MAGPRAKRPTRRAPTPVVRSESSWYDLAFEQLAALIDAPERFVSPNEVLRTDLLRLVKQFYDHAKAVETIEFGPLPELLIEGLDCEQIWEEIELRADPLLDCLKQRVRDLQHDADHARPATAAPHDRHDCQHESDNESAKYMQQQCSDDDDDDDLLEEVASDDDSDGQSSEHDSAEDQDVANGDDDDEREVAGDADGADPFFNIDEMDRFADEMEYMDGAPKKNKRKRVDDDQSDDDDDSGEELMNMLTRDDDEEEDSGDDGEPVGRSSNKYDDFFDPAVDMRSDPATADGENVDDDDEFQDLTDFQRRQLKLAEEIRQLEQRNVSKRSWELMGEATAADRPADTLIDAPLDFEMADKRPELITEEITQDLEALIKQRIRDSAFDDVERKVLPQEKPFVARSELETDKSQVGLAELYEKEYVEKATGVSKNEEELSAEHKTIASLFAGLCYQLDTLSNFAFTPKPCRLEAVVRTVNVPAITMEEAIPMGVSSATLIAPEELCAPADALPTGETERSREEKRRTRRVGKERRRKHDAERKAADELLARHDDKFREKKETKEAKIAAAASKEVSGHKVDHTQYTRSTDVFKKIQAAADQPKKKQKALPNPVSIATTKPSTSFKL